MTIHPISPYFGTVLLALALSSPASELKTCNNIALGALAFADNCMKCHQIDGYGEEALYPSLHNPVLLQDKTLLIQTLLSGRAGHRENPEGESMQLMPSLDFLTDTEIAAIIAFITNSWGDQFLEVTEEEVRNARASMSSDGQDANSPVQ